MHSLEQNFIKVIHDFKNEYKLNKEYETLNVGVLFSGGVDSVVLGHIASKLKSTLNMTLTLIHLEFDDFPSHKKATELFNKTVYEYNTSYKTFKSEISKIETGVKNLAREELLSAAFSDKYDLVLSGHHADDQIETILFRFLRGSGPSGLVGMSSLTEFIRDGYTHVRCKPFLNNFKKEIVTYADYHGLNYVNDETNDNNSSDRNFLRNEIIPKLNSRFNVSNILSLSKYIQEQLNQKSDTIDIDIYKGEWEINEFIKLPVLNRVFIIKEYLSRVLGFNVNKSIHKALSKVLSEDLSNVRLYLGGGFQLKRECNVILVTYIKD